VVLIGDGALADLRADGVVGVDRVLRASPARERPAQAGVALRDSRETLPQRGT
jgi:hypothetical protein